ncbi:hypothetical protein A1351_05630 [Methylosinus sp. R-45379]|jgi:heme/copper-type cytochrome/quinol oxidase subunit 4|uniref:hypothetical protein n=1 Tax=unclassified Methylosinus TaxID=2624500 RepID=UPI0004651B4E|nr:MULTISPECIES: hypothetical protein [unclassified Methylosinus]OAI31346.1 hypothetical protein A1351_05630 [Methylosinus sp. R-45379]TDX62204.1 hypothetical protein EDE12_111111 [Methylosinus sp. sav-2]
MRWEQALTILLLLAFYLIPFASVLATRGWRSLAAVSILWLAVIAFLARPLFDHPSEPRCGLGEMISLIVATLVAAAFATSFVGRVLLSSNPTMARAPAATMVVALGLAGFAGVAWLFRGFFS